MPKSRKTQAPKSAAQPARKPARKIGEPDPNATTL
jgi:hypothetical protein